MKISPELLHKKIKLARQHRKLTQKDLARLIGCTAGAVSQWEAEDPSKRTVPSLHFLYSIAQVTDFWVGWFVEDKRPADVTSPLCQRPILEKL